MSLGFASKKSVAFAAYGIGVCVWLVTSAIEGALSQSVQDRQRPEIYSGDLEYRGSEKGAQYEICRAYWEGMKERQAPVRYCGIALPSKSREFSLPLWEPIDPGQHMDLVREIFYWSNINQGQVGWDNYYNRQLQTDAILPDLLEKVWSSSSSEVERLVSVGKIRLERSVIDIDFDGKRETVYRMTPVYGPDGYKRRIPAGSDYQPVNIINDECVPARLDGGDEQYVTYVRLADARLPHLQLRVRHLLPGMRLFLWRGRVYWLAEGASSSVIEPTTRRGQQETILSLVEICSFRIRRIGTPN